MREALLAALSAVAVFVPKLLLFIVIVVVGWLIAKVVAKAIDKVLEKVGFDRAVERGGIKKALAKSKYDASAIVGKIVFYFLILFVLQLAFGVFGNNPVSDLLSQIIAFLPRLFIALIIVVIASAIAAAAKGLVQNTLAGLSYGKTLANIAGIAILGLGVIAALNQVGIATTVTTPVLIAVLAAVAGILIVGVGGGLIKPMQNRWESYLTKAEEEAPKIKEHAANAPDLKEQARQAKEQAQDQLAPSGQGQQSGHSRQSGHSQQSGHSEQFYDQTNPRQTAPMYPPWGATQQNPSRQGSGGATPMQNPSAGGWNSPPDQYPPYPGHESDQDPRSEPPRR